MQTNNSNTLTPRFWKTPYGVVNAVEDDNIVTCSLRQHGKWVESELDLLSRLIEEDARVVEIGSEYGVHALFLSKVVGAAGEVHVFEDDRMVHLQLCANIALNGIGNIHAHFSGKNGDIVGIRELGLTALRCIKINQPGALLGVLSDAKELVRQHKPYLYFRLSSPTQSHQEVSAVKALGYRCWSHMAYLHTPRDASESDGSDFPGWAHQNVIAAPLESGVDADFADMREI